MQVRILRPLVASAPLADIALLASHNVNNSLLVGGPVISLARRHAKVRREGYRR